MYIHITLQILVWIAMIIGFSVVIARLFGDLSTPEKDSQEVIDLFIRLSIKMNLREEL